MPATDRRVRIDRETKQERFLRVLTEATAAIEAAGIPCALLGGIASAALGRPRWTHDVDLFVRAGDARAALDALGGAGFETEETNPNWLYKATKDGTQVDLLFKAKGDIYFDDEMIARCREEDFEGLRVRTIPPEDLIVIKAIIHDEDTPRHWWDALGVLASTPGIDWEYLLRRAQHGARRVLSLLLYAQSTDLIVPDRPIEQLFETIFEGRES